MATNSAHEKWEQVEAEEKEEEQEEAEEEEEEEALSLCDLPLNLINDEDQSRKPDSKVIETQEEFDFRSRGGLFSKESEMCAADEVFFQGQILPLRLSFGSESGLITTGSQPDNHQINRFESRSQSLDRGSLTGFGSISSRSSSLRSQNSSSSTSSTPSTTPRIFKPRIQNHSHMHPSPKPHLRVSGPKQASFHNPGRKSSPWELLRLGVVPAPEIGLQDLKARSSTNGANKNSVTRNSSSGSSNSNSTFNGNSTTKSVKTSKSNHVFKQFVGKSGTLMSGCKCSIETVQSMQSDMDVIKSGGTKSSTNKTERTTHAVKEKVLELKKQKQRQKQGKKVMSRRRTFEWLKELHASYPDEEAMLSNS